MLKVQNGIFVFQVYPKTPIKLSRYVVQINLMPKINPNQFLSNTSILFDFLSV